MVQNSLKRDAPSIVDGEFAFSGEDFRKIAAMLHADAGIYLPDAKATLVYSRLVKRLRLLGLNSFGEYCALVADSAGADERQKMLAALTTNVTRFFREPHHFQHLKEKTLPPLLQAARKGGRVRIWSAGCSRGHEPYSLAMTVLSMLPDAADRDIRILASDIDPNVVAEGREGVYEDSEISSVPPAERARYFTAAQSSQSGSGKRSQVNEELRRLVTFRELNLIGQWPMKGPFDVIFCRNVVIYFDEQTQAKIWSRFAPLLAPRGLLCIGHSERLTGPALPRFESVGITTYQLTGGRA